MTIKYQCIELSEPQKKIVEHLDGPMLVSAGPGSGKTRVIVERIAHMINNGIKPECILATTFTRKAADEMNSRLSAKGMNTGRMSVQTMHALCWRIIRDHKSFKGWKVDDKEIHRIALKQLLGYKQMNWVGVDISKVEGFISSARNSLVSPENSAGFLAPMFRDPRYSQAYRAYHEQMQERRLITFDDMLYYGVWLLENDSRTLDRMQGKYLYVMVDEFQDSNFAQLQLAELLATPEFNYVAVGDIDQAIYSWRGALPEFMLEFSEKYGAEIVELGVNYRCAPAIMGAAANCIVKNERRFSKELEANRTKEARIQFLQATNTDEEALMVREEIEAIKADGIGYGNIRVLMRTNAQSRAIEEEFVRAKIPFVVLGSLSFYDRKEIADLLAYLRVLYDPRDTKAGGRAINRPFRYVNRQILDDIEDVTMRGGNYIDAAASRLENTRLGSARDWCEMMGGFDVENDTPADVIRTVVNETDYLDYLMDAEGTDTPETSRAGNVGELIASATRFKTIPDFIEYVDNQIKLRKRNQRKQEDSRVQVMTIHKCVDPNTLVETDQGTIRIRDINSTGTIATADGPLDYANKTSYENCDMLTIQTEGGYELTVTHDHGMMSWVGDKYTRVNANQLKEGDFLRLKLGSTCESTNPSLPKPPNHDIRAVIYKLPTRIPTDIAEFLGLFVADGTLYHSGFRLVKQHKDVRDRFSYLCKVLFKCTPHDTQTDNAFMSEINSTYLSAWLNQIDGLQPNQKSIPTCILMSDSFTQAAFIRGLMEDGTVNIKDGKIDHIGLYTVYETIASQLQTLLLRQNIISRRFKSRNGWRVDISSAHTHTYKQAIGFISKFKSDRLLLPTSDNTGHVIPVNKDWIRTNVTGSEHHRTRTNALTRGYVSRHVASELGLDLSFHHVRIKSITSSVGPAMCVEVPTHGRFLQNGFDGCNSKGTEANAVFLIGANDGIIPHAKGDEEEERRLFYVAITRAKDRLIVSMTSGQTFGGNVGDMQPSRFAYEAGIVPDEESLTDSSRDDMVRDLSEGKHAHTENVSCESVESIHRRN